MVARTQSALFMLAVAAPTSRPRPRPPVTVDQPRPRRIQQPPRGQPGRRWRRGNGGNGGNGGDAEAAFERLTPPNADEILETTSPA